jgi:uncharacterized SAM-binding protein YcdF (DUF218 family)
MTKSLAAKPVAKNATTKPIEKKGWRLWQRRPCVLPTWRGWLLIAVLAGAVGIGGIRGAYPFLALNDPKPGGVLVVEGWAPDFALEAAIAEAKQYSYEKVFVTGGPIESGEPLSEYKTYAERGTATLLALGMSTNLVQAVPAPRVRQDRTYSCALALKKWANDHGRQFTRVNLLTVGPHARRSRLLFEKALGRELPIGVIAVPEPDYDTRHWWRSSNGFRSVTGEAIAYVYARFLFHARDQQQS